VSDNTKACTKCGEIKPATLEFFHKDPHKKTGLTSHCKSCKSQYHKNNLKIYREYYRKNREDILEKRKHYREANHEKIIQRDKIYREVNSEFFNASHRKAKRKRKALRLQNGHSPYSEAEVLNTYGTNCHLCGQSIDFEAPRSSGAFGWELGLHIDHVIPISKGGSDTLENVKPAHGRCNVSKGNRLASGK
jgi:5-methylcytosine-specific restriction endonuclease McrA